MNLKNIERIFTPPAPHFVGDGFRVHNFIPGIEELSMRRMDPFLLLDYNSKVNFPPSEKPRGVGVHPHKGFETVTIAYQGKIQHHDSNGGGGIIGEGDIQWMTAASGILHKEYHELEFSKKGGEFQMVQLWVNLPEKYKKSQPKYQPILNSKIPKYNFGNMSSIEIIAGEYFDIKGVAETYSPINLFNVKSNKDDVAEFHFPSYYNTFLLVIEGEILVNDISSVQLDNLALFENSGEKFFIKSIQDSVVLILSGEPLNEPLSAYGPFVMNTREEILEAYREFNSGKFGFLED